MLDCKCNFEIYRCIYVEIFIKKNQALNQYKEEKVVEYKEKAYTV